MREITCAAITATVRDLCIQANCQLPSDVRSAICAACAQERSPVGQSILHDLVENYTYAGERNLPICQDTGMAVVFIDLGQECHITGGALEDAVNAGVAAGYTEGFLRKSIVSDPLRRVNTEDNTPAVLHLRLVPGDQMSITVAPKGAGSENMTTLKMLKPTTPLDEVENAIIQAVEEAGSNPCPPVVVGIGYELIRICGRYDNLATRIISAPGLWMQRLTVKEPDDSMIEVAIEAMKAVIPEDGTDLQCPLQAKQPKEKTA